jgi:hypothetical protein
VRPAPQELASQVRQVEDIGAVHGAPGRVNIVKELW